MAKLVVFGIGKIAEQAIAYLINDSPHEVVALTVDAHYVDGSAKYDLPVVPFEEVERKYPPAKYEMFVAVGYQDLNAFRAGKCAEAKAKGYRLATYVSSRASVAPDVTIPENCFIGDFTVIQPSATIGRNVFIYPGGYIAHHASVGDNSYIAGNVVVAGSSSVGAFCFVGISVSIGHEITIGERSFIGAGAVITKSVPPKSVHIVPDTPRFRLDSDAFLRLTKMK